MKDATQMTEAELRLEVIRLRMEIETEGLRHIRQMHEQSLRHIKEMDDFHRAHERQPLETPKSLGLTR